MFNPLGAVFSTAAGAAKGMVEGAEEGIKTGKRGSFFDLITVPVGAVAGAVTGTTAGASIGLTTSVKNDVKALMVKDKHIEWNPIKCAGKACDRMDEVAWREDIVRPVAKVANAVAIGATAGALASTGVGAVAGTWAVGAAVTTVGTAAVTKGIIKADKRSAKR